MKYNLVITGEGLDPERDIALLIENEIVKINATGCGQIIQTGEKIPQTKIKDTNRTGLKNVVMGGSCSVACTHGVATDPVYAGGHCGLCVCTMNSEYVVDGLVNS